jgi:hypothetical protein
MRERAMHNDWMIEVLADMRRFAEANGLPVLAETLAQTALVAASEIARARHQAQTAQSEDAQSEDALTPATTDGA